MTTLTSAMRYFLKEVLRAKIVFSDGSVFNGWQVVGSDQGVLATENPGIIRELEANIRGQRGGVSEITAEQFLEWQSKKKEPLKTPWREEWKPRHGNSLEARFRARALADPAAGNAPEPEKAARAAPAAGSEGQFRPAVKQTPK